MAKIMFKVYISYSVYQAIVRTEEQKVVTKHSYLYKLLKQQPVQKLTSVKTAVIKFKPEEILKNPSAL